MELTTCPECGLPAELLDRFALYSTDGRIEHVKIACVNKHWFVVPEDRLGFELGHSLSGPFGRAVRCAEGTPQG